MLNIGSKKYRNIQEQVGYNTECIKELAEAIDGITLEDKLVLIANNSGTFSPEELDILSGPLAFISNGSRVWIKDSETVSEFVYKAIDIKADEVSSSYFNIGGSKIVVIRATGAFAVSDDLIITTYSKSQLDSKLAVKANSSDVYNKTETDNKLSLKANLLGADFTGPVTTSSTLEQATPNLSLDITIQNPPANWSIEFSYKRLIIVNTTLKMIINAKVTNNSESAQSFPDITLATTSVPSKYGAKIVDFEGKTLNEPQEPSNHSCLIRAGTCSIAQNLAGWNPVIGFSTITRYSSAIYINFGYYTSLSVPAGSSKYISAEINLSLL